MCIEKTRSGNVTVQKVYDKFREVDKYFIVMEKLGYDLFSIR